MLGATPARSRIFAPDLVAGVEQDELGEKAAKELTGRVWKVFKVSPLFGFDQSSKDLMSEIQSHLQGYIDKIDTIQITSKSNPEELIFNEENDNDKHFTQFDPEKQWFWVSVEYVKGLRGSREDCDAVQIQVKQNLKGVRGGLKEKVWSTCLLILVAAKESTFYSKNVVQLPLCLTYGDIILNRMIFLGLQHKFDCTIFPLELPEEELMWMSAMWSSIPPPSSDNKEQTRIESSQQKMAGKRSVPDNISICAEEPTQDNNLMTEDGTSSAKGDEVRFRFELADDKKMQGLDHLDVTLKGKEVRQLWENLRKTKRVENESENRDMLQEDMEQFHHTLRTHVRKTTKLRLDDRSVFALTQIELPIMNVSRNGKLLVLKGISFLHVHTILEFFTKMCQCSIPSAAPRLFTKEAAEGMSFELPQSF